MIGGLFGAMGIFARPFGGWIADKFGGKLGLRGRVFWLFIALFLEGLALMLFSRMDAAATVIPALILTGLLVHASCGATYAVVPFVNRKATGAVSGIVGAGGNAIAVAIMFLFKESVFGLSWPEAFLITGLLVTGGSFLALVVRFSPEAEAEVKAETRRIADAVTSGAMPQPA